MQYVFRSKAQNIGLNYVNCGFATDRFLEGEGKMFGHFTTDSTSLYAVFIVVLSDLMCVQHILN